MRLCTCVYVFVFICVYVCISVHACIFRRVRTFLCADESFTLFHGISTFVGYLMPNPSLKKNCSDTI